MPGGFPLEPYEQEGATIQSSSAETNTPPKTCTCAHCVLGVSPSCSDNELKQQYQRSKAKLGPNRPEQRSYISRAYKCILADRRARSLRRYAADIDYDGEDLGRLKSRVVKLDSRLGSDVAQSPRVRRNDMVGPKGKGGARVT